MARIRTRSGPYVAFMPLAAGEAPICQRCKAFEARSNEAIRLLHHGHSDRAMSLAVEDDDETEGHRCTKMANSSGMNPRRGNWVSVSVYTGMYDPILGERRILRDAADVWFDPPRRFIVTAAPLGMDQGRTVQYYLDRLDDDEISRLFADLKEADERHVIDTAGLAMTA